jgi:hypothetical protein
VLYLIPKVSGADQISQFRPIALINVIFKIVSKTFASKLDPIANMIISPNQTDFIKGRLITDGVPALQEVIHELKVKKLAGASFLKSILRKLMTELTGTFSRRYCGPRALTQELSIVSPSWSRVARPPSPSTVKLGLSSVTRGGFVRVTPCLLCFSIW